MTFPVPLPPEAPLAMPEQLLHGNPPGTIEVRTAPPGLLAKRLLLIVATAVLGMYASTGLRVALGEDGIGLLDVLLLALFVPLVAGSPSVSSAGWSASSSSSPASIPASRRSHSRPAHCATAPRS